MDKIELKANLHQFIDQLDNIDLLKKYYNELKMMVKNPKSSSWDSLSKAKKEDVLLAFEESETEQYLIDNQEIENKLKKKL
ncbi:MAG: hypothetical protein KF732_07665 [Flavobacteriales bacterium]|jgi:hypothetical protein|nr:hypothetical protein [Flavobacteriales bacterium]